MGHHWLAADNMHGERLDHGGRWVAKSPPSLTFPKYPCFFLTPSPLSSKGPRLLSSMSQSLHPSLHVSRNSLALIVSHLGFGLNRFTCAFSASPQAWASRHSFFQKPQVTAFAQIPNCDPYTLTSKPLASALDTSLLQK